MHRVVIVVIVVILAMLILCYSIRSHATLILYYDASKLTLHTFLMSRVLWVVTCMIDIREITRVYTYILYGILSNMCNYSV
jgi:hypothetical protein